MLSEDDLTALPRFGTGGECERLAEKEAVRNADRRHIDGNPKQAHMVHTDLHKDHKPMWQIPDDIPLFTMATVAKAAEVAPATMRAWFQRGHVRLNDGDTERHINGAPNKFTARSVLMLALTAELVRQGASPAIASRAADHWMRDGVAEGQQGAPALRRSGGLFPAPYMTYLVMGAEVEPESSREPVCRIAGIDPQASDAHSTLFGALFFRGRASAKIVLLNLIDRRVRQVCHEAILGDGAPPEPDWEAVATKMLTPE